MATRCERCGGKMQVVLATRTTLVLLRHHPWYLVPGVLWSTKRHDPERLRREIAEAWAVVDEQP